MSSSTITKPAPAEGSQWNDESEWIHDWDYKRILPEYTKRPSSGVLEIPMDVAMDVDAEGLHPLSGQKPSAAYDQEMAIFWSRIPKYLSDSSSEISDHTEFHAMDFHELNDELVALEPDTNRSSNDLTAFNKPPPFSWDQQQTMDDSMKVDVDSVMSSPLQDDEGLLQNGGESKYYPRGETSNVARAPDDAMNMDDSVPGMGKSMSNYPQQLLKDVVKHPRHTTGQPEKLPTAPKGQQEQLLKEMRHSYQERQPRQKLPSPPQEQQKLLQEMRHRGHSKKKKHDIYNRQQQILQQQFVQTPHAPSVPGARTHLPSPPAGRTPPRRASSVSVMSVSSSPISVSEIFSADLSQEDYHAKVRELTEKNLFQRQQSLLQESMRRTLESRQALRVETSWPQQYERGDKLMQVLEQVDSTSLKISQTYHLKIGFGAA
ncbi:unnamed protein product [Cylindrotheca closterium]|uniref:Uncharacterized protein n=1 Tax=Cylindrotheca closterium TaxID=2856 RepID=A0AAD2CJY8_9STRA|nr:unnamed protein product [Cylindrotheca closterium]